jgi:hypothetical protein
MLHFEIKRIIKKTCKALIRNPNGVTTRLKIRQGLGIESYWSSGVVELLEYYFTTPLPHYLTTPLPVKL